jgi:hypothetical protein
MINQTKKLVTMPSILMALLLGIGLGSQYALAQDTISHGASGLSPGILKSTETDSQSANTISPGASESAIEQHGRLPGGGCLASEISPGNLFRQEPTTTDTNP